MLPMLTQHKMITAALLASLSLTACGSKKDVIAAPPATPETQPAPAASPAVKADAAKSGTKSADANGQAGGSLPDPENGEVHPPIPEESGKDTAKNPGKGKPAQQPNPLSPTPLPVKAGTTPPPAPAAPAKPAPPAPPAQTAKPVLPTPVVAGTKPAPAAEVSQLPSDYVSNDPANVSRDNLSKRMTGAVTADGLVYTSSSTDDLLNYLRARNDKVGAETRRLNLQAAASVVSAKLSLDAFSGDAIVTLKIQEGSETKIYNLAGANGEGGYAAKLRVVRGANDEKTTGVRAIEGTLKCVDLDGGCENTLVRLKIGSAPSAIVSVVFRNSQADTYTNLPEKYSDNPEYLWIRDFFISSAKQLNVTNKIKSIRMSSYEVVNGRSGVALTIKGVNNELLGFAGPLLAPEAGTGVSVNLARIAKDQDDSLDLISLDNTQLTYANSIGEARMVANNGLGQVRLLLKMRKRASFPQDQFMITFMRKIKPLVELNEDSLSLK